MVNPQSAVPLYQQVSDDIKSRILSGEYAAGQMLPSETRFCEIYDVSRVTLRNAISDLVEQGLIVKRHGKGTFVEQRKINSDLFTFSGFTTSCRKNHIDTMTHILFCGKQPASMYDVRELQLKPGDEVIYLKRQRFAEGRPVLLEHAYLEYKKYSFLLETDMENRSLYTTLFEHTGINPEKLGHTSFSLEVDLATKEEAHYMDLSEGDPVFILKETVADAFGHPIHWTKQILSGKHFKYSLTSNQSQISIKL